MKDFNGRDSNVSTWLLRIRMDGKKLNSAEEKYQMKFGNEEGTWEICEASNGDVKIYLNGALFTSD